MKVIIGDYVSRNEYSVEPDAPLKTVCPFPSKEFIGNPMANGVLICADDFNKSVKELANGYDHLLVIFIIKCGDAWYVDSDGFHRKIC